MVNETSTPRPARWWPARLALLATAWWAVVEGRPVSWPFLVAGVGAAAATAWALRTEARWSAAGFARFVPFFVVQSVRGGVDVALRALLPGDRIRPGFVTHPCRLPEGAPRVFLAKVLSLLPGTLSCDLDGDLLTVHLLDTDLAAGVAAVESRVADLYGAGPLTPTPGTPA